MLHRLPDRVEPWILAEAGREFSGGIGLAKMPRLMDALADSQGEIQVEIHFDRDEIGTRYMAGRITGELMLVCQRCLKPVEHEIDTEFRLALVHDEEQGKRLPSHYEPLMIAPGPMPLSELMEDEVLLALPIVAMHQSPHPCAESKSPDPRPQGETRENPFAVLAQLKRE